MIYLLILDWFSYLFFQITTKMLNLTKLTKRFTPNTIKNINTKTTLYVKNVPFNISNNQIRKYFNCHKVFRPKIGIFSFLYVPRDQNNWPSNQKQAVFKENACYLNFYMFIIYASMFSTLTEDKQRKWMWYIIYLENIFIALYDSIE